MEEFKAVTREDVGYRLKCNILIYSNSIVLVVC